MIANPSKFQAIVLSKSKGNIRTSFHIKDIVINSKESVELLGVTFDEKLKFDCHISKLCRRACGQLNALFRFKRYLSPDSKKLAVNSFILSNFNYCSLIWNFSSSYSLNKIERIQERALRFLCENNTKSYNDLLNDLGKCTMKTKRMRALATEIFKTLNNINPLYMKHIFYQSTLRRSERLKYNLEVPKLNLIKYGRKSLRVLGPSLWNSLPNDVKSLQTLTQFKSFIKTWGCKGCPFLAKFESYQSALR